MAKQIKLENVKISGAELLADEDFREELEEACACGDEFIDTLNKMVITSTVFDIEDGMPGASTSISGLIDGQPFSASYDYKKLDETDGQDGAYLQAPEAYKEVLEGFMWFGDAATIFLLKLEELAS